VFQRLPGKIVDKQVRKSIYTGNRRPGHSRKTMTGPSWL
jgi:hypothetical protein